MGLGIPEVTKQSSAAGGGDIDIGHLKLLSGGVVFLISKVYMRRCFLATFLVKFFGQLSFSFNWF